MAATKSGRNLTEQHRKDQLAVRASFLKNLVDAWPLLDPRRLDQTMEAWIKLMLDLIASGRKQSVTKSVEYYGAFRAAETGLSHFDGSRYGNFDNFSQDAARVSLLVTGPLDIRHRTAQGADPDEAARSAFVRVSGSASRHVLNGGRDVLDTITTEDQTALGWARVTDSNPCAFCALLASRGPVYRSQEAAERTTGKAKKRSSGQQYHDGCGCTSEPVFTEDQPWPGAAKEYEQLYIDSTADAKGADKIKAFRKAYREQGYGK